MTVFPESLSKIDTENQKEAINILESYIRYMCERIDFSINKVEKEINSINSQIDEIINQ